MYGRSRLIPSVLLLATLAPGCSSPSASNGGAGIPESTYPIGAHRSLVSQRRAGSGLIIILETLPDDEFLLATVRGMLATGKPRPTYYETFPVSGSAGVYRDYVFYDSQQRVMYVARRRIG